MNYLLVFAWNVRKWRLSRKMSQLRFAEIANLPDQKAVHQIEYGKENLTYSTMLNISKGTEISLSTLFSSDDTPNEILEASEDKQWTEAELKILTDKYIS